MKKQANRPSGKGFRLGLQGKTLLGLLGSLTLVLLAAGFILLRQANAKIAQLTDTNIANQAVSIRLETEGYFDQFLRSLDEVADLELVRSIVEEANGEDAKFRFESSALYDEASRQLFRSIEHFPDGAQNLFVACEHTNQTMRSNGTTSDPGYVVSERPWWKLLEEKGGACVTGAYQDVVTGGLVVTAAAPIYSGGKLVGAVGSDVSLENLSASLKRFKVGETGYVVVYDSTNAIVYHPDASLVLTNIEATDYSDNMKAAVTSNEDVIGMTYHRGDQVYHGTTLHLDSVGWQVIGCMPDQEFSREINLFGRNILFCFLLVALILAMVAAVNVRGMVRPIRKLVHVSDKLAQGELDVQVDTRGNDEISAYKSTALCSSKILHCME